MVKNSIYSSADARCRTFVEKDGRTRSFLTSNLNSAQLWFPELSPQLQERGKITISRGFPSVIFGTNFATQLHALNVDTLVICGAHTSISVRAITLDAM
jgi:nicotinamidase-related amidase